MLKSIRLRNFKKHADLRVEFDSGLTSVTGENASGKSTILRAILFCLFGTEAAGSKANLTRWNADGPMLVELRAVLGGQEVMIERNLKSARVLTADNTVLASGHDAVTAWVSEQYGMPDKDLRLLMYSKQKETHALLSMGATGLNKLVERLAGAEAVDKVLALVGPDVSKLEGELAGIGEVEDLEELEWNVGLAEVVATEAEAELARAQCARDAAYAAVKQASEDHDHAQRIEAERQRLQSSLAAESTARAAAHDSIQRAEFALAVIPEDAAEQAEAAGKEVEAAAQEESRLKLEMYGLKQKLDRKAALPREIGTMARMAEESEAAQAAWDQVAKEADDLYAEVAKLQAEYNLRLKQESEAVKACKDAVCVTCKRPFSEEEAVEAQARLDAARANAATAKGLLADRQRDLVAAQQDQKAIGAKIDRTAAARLSALYAEEATLSAISPDDLKMPQDFLDRTSQARLDAQKRREDWLLKANERRRLSETLRLAKAEFEGRSAAVEHIEGALNTLPEPYDLADLRRIWDEASAAARQAVEAASQARTAKELADQSLQAASLKLEDAKMRDARRRQVQHDLRLRQSLQKFLRKQRGELMGDTHDALFAVASRMLSDTTSGRLSGVIRGEGGIALIEDGVRVPIDEASGYQQSLAGLCLRLSMARVFFGPGLPALLDEVTADASEGNAARVAGMLAGLGGQVLMVTHRSGDMVNSGQVVELS